MIPLILDTDIGDDIDDALALALILATPQLDLRAVTTVWGDTVARSRQARTLLRLANRPEIPVAAGCGGSLARSFLPRTICDHAEPWHLAREHVAPNQDGECLPEAQLPPLDRRHAIQVLIEGLTGEVVPVTIGAMTNLAAALVADVGLAQRIPRLVCMAAEFRTPFAEWNIRCDPEAARLVFTAGFPVEVIPWHIGMRCTFTEAELATMDAIGTPSARWLHRCVSRWRSYNKNRDLPHLYDPMAVAILSRPDLCEWRQGRVTVECQGEGTYGFTQFHEDAAGPHRIAWEVDRDAAIAYYLERLATLR